MYTDAKKKNTLPVIMCVIAALILAAAVFIIVSGSDRDLSDESAAAIRSAIQRGALQCYVVEGCYPPNLKYLEENYGIQVNTGDFYVTYDAFASNLPPTVIVTPKK